MTHVGFIGLGSQGAPMARRIVGGGFPLTLWARRPESLQSFGDTPASFASTPQELAAQCSVVCVCVTSDRDVEDVLLGTRGVFSGLQRQATIVIHSTVHPSTCIRLRERATDLGAELLDAPVSGGGDAAANGHLLVMVGGETSALQDVQPVLATYGDPILHCGAIGTGQIAKLVNNLVFTAHLATAADTFAFADRLGVDRAVLAQVLARGSGSSQAAAILSNAGFDLQHFGPVAGPLLRKDLALIVDVAEQRRADLPPTLLDLASSALSRLTPEAGRPD